MELAVPRADPVAQHDHVVAEIAAGARGALDAALGGDAADNDRLHAPAPEHQIEIGADKAVGPALLEYDVARLGFETLDDFAAVRIVFFFCRELAGIGYVRPLHSHAHPRRGLFAREIVVRLHGIKDLHT